ncbi:permease prefix domain 1-containing protein [Flavonifractor plautii]|uniref:permease prefix domain 1-containing protein n=1 Tax=Flavonifractor plautii TaxID=292800 RepID=UPI001958FC85|nr:permease prefix domain 1-containing protein [Flavonifractor plautii]MBM6664803.1 hypothetical protein [Flavonifractor plautii]
MASKPFDRFCDQVCASIRWPPARRLAREELTAHLEDHAAALEEQGVPPEDAALRAVEAMGDPQEIGRQLDRCHSPLVPRLSKIFVLCACALFLIGFCAGVLHQTGFFRYEAVLLPTPTLPGWNDGDLLCEGDIRGVGQVGGYAIQAKDAALVHLHSSKYRPSRLEIQAAVTVSHWQPWLDHLTTSIPAVWTDSDGASGTVSCYSTDSTLLAQNWYLILEDPTPGCRWFSVTLGRPGDQCTLEITLDEEVPPA